MKINNIALSVASELFEQSKMGRQIAEKGFKLESVAIEGLQGYNLDPIIKNLYPVSTPLRNRIPRVKKVGGNSFNWKQFTKLNRFNIGSNVEDGKRAGIVDHVLEDKMFMFKSWGLEDFATWNAELASLNLDTRSHARYQIAEKLLQSIYIEEERKILGGNSVEFGKTPNPVLTAGTDGSIAAGDVSVVAVALSYFGRKNASVNNGLRLTVDRLNADNTTTFVKGGYAQKSDAVEVTVAANGSIEVLVPDLNIASGYAIYAGQAGSERLQYVGINKTVLTSLRTDTQLLSAIGNTDESADKLEFDGLLTQAATGGGAFLSLDGKALTGTGLVINEIEAVVTSIKDTTDLDVNVMVMSNKSYSAFFNALRGKDTANIIVVNDGSSKSAGGKIDSYVSAYTGQSIEIIIDTHLEADKILFLCDNMDEFPVNGVDNMIAMAMQEDYTMIEWPLRTRKYEFGTYATGVLQHAYPQSMGYIKNIG